MPFYGYPEAYMKTALKMHCSGFGQKEGTQLLNEDPTSGLRSGVGHSGLSIYAFVESSHAGCWGEWSMSYG